MKIVVLDAYSVNPGDLSWDGLKEMGEVVVYPRTAAGEILERSKDAEVILTNKVPFNVDTLSRLPKLKMIGVLATGFNIIDTEAARTRGIMVCNIPAYSTYSVAQMVFAHILNITNRVDSFARQNREGRWSQNPDFCYWDAPIHELAGKTIGIVGLGNIGCKVARIARDFGMDVFAYTSKNSADLPEGIQKTTMEGLLGVSDILTLHCPLTPETREMINKDSLCRMKRGAILINTGRGPLVNERDVASALASGQLGAYGADVMCSEPPAADNPLLSQPHAYLTPHVAWATCEARSRLMEIAVANVRAFAEGTPQNVVNP
ncbi:D-2-hydroxyacid dehydrogenase [Prevotella sp. KH2C16]|uniref:D-2-hydroxyacid dehydrogenase n=1 Tax=Prevotella sp. KH2C16 TaxID=1855325 RepID=UPI0008E20DB5|nr:D-2-hydroxyacid dehydrogenase [Prevotella sp. KH2C16]SFG22797.1 glycerate dehydrogenase [Prevotella sp. KH2C16]